MPPKIKITKEEIINTAIELIKRNGTQSVNARSIAAALNCSTQPIFSNFVTMEELQKEVLSKVYGYYAEFLEEEMNSGKYPPYKSYGMAYIRFAMEEKELFKLLFMRDRSDEDMTPTPDFDASIQIIMKANGLDIEKARLMHLEMWTCVHGIGVMIATSFLPLETELISNILTDVYQGIRARQLTEENNNGGN